ncbi:hypothetical protein LSH36_439g03041 [Paralvinella palmiformis]|uniref:Uncharacterized protein n=1 Tax=Paralvinella palmiformis TaxID=53620 RepID=A0AAD9JAW9_9ANNE|nr:hypothetical protein LSH36_439g03041 [Paralvinella palmiformis]
MLAPVVVVICRRKSARLLALVGGLITSLACLFMSFSRLHQQLAVSMMVVLPLGSGLSLTTAVVMLGRYFRKRRECAEMLALCGSGVGMAVVSVFQAQVFSTLSWMRAMQALSGLMVPTLLAGAVYRSPTIYHPRRKVILHLKSLAKTKKQRKEFENKPPYFDFSPLRMRAMHVLLTSTAVINVGTYVPFVLLPNKATGDKITKPSYNLLMVFLGVAFAFGCLLFGLIVVRSSVSCMISRQYLVQLTSLGCGVSTLLFSLAHHFDGYALYVWVYGLCCGGYTYSIRMYTYEQVTVKLAERTAGYMTFVQGLPVLFGVPLARWLDEAGGSTDNRFGFVFAGVCMLLGGAILLLMPWAGKHKSNWEVIKTAHLKATGSSPDDVILFDMNVSDHTNSGLAKQNHLAVRLSNVANHKMALTQLADRAATWRANPSCCSENDPWSAIETMSPMSATDKVTEFLVHSQNMLQNFSRMHSIQLPNVRLEINNQYTLDPELAPFGDRIKDLTLQATVCRNSPHKPAVRCRADGTGSDVTSESRVADETAAHAEPPEAETGVDHPEHSRADADCTPLANHTCALIQSRDVDVPREKTTTV